MKERTAVNAAMASLAVAVPFVMWALAPVPRGADALAATPGPASALAPAAPAPPGPPPALPVTRLTLAKGDTLAGKLVAAGLGPVDAARVSKGLARTLDPRRLMPGTVLEITTTTDGGFASCDVIHEGRCLARATREGTGVTGQELVPILTEVTGIAGAVAGSLKATVALLGEHPELAASLARLFGPEVSAPAAAGRRLSVLVEKHWKDGRFHGYGRILAASLEGRGEERTLLLFPTRQGPGYFTLEGEGLGTVLRSPLPQGRISSGYSARRLHPIHRRYRPHLGVDLAAPAGTPVVAAGAGRVTFAAWSGGLGKTVEIAHGEGLQSLYGHLKGFAKGIERGSRVEAGQVIGYVGSTGWATGPHLDFRLKVKGSYVDPVNALAMAGRPRLSGPERARFEEVKARVLPALRDMLPGTRRVAAVADAS